jgi:hypothetical protein
MVGTLPGIPDFAGELIVVAGNAYLRAPGENIYSTMAASSLSLNPVDASSGLLPEFQTVLTTIADKNLTPQLLGVETCAGGPCYHIAVQATPSVVDNGLGLVGQGVGYAKVDVWINTSSFLVDHIELHTSDSVAGSAAIRLVLSEYNSVSPIYAPAPGQFDPSGLSAPAAS